LTEIQEQFRLTFLFIAHDLAVVSHISDRVAVMYLGKIMEVGEREQVYSRPQHPYTLALLSAIPIPDPEVEADRHRISLIGEAPSPVDPPSGCRFRTRCWLREQLNNPPECSSVEPVLRESSAGGEVACHWSEKMPSMQLTRVLG
jgi:oligopeptide/dipeptide ABC transporter ATP-binding protein